MAICWATNQAAADADEKNGNPAQNLWADLVIVGRPLGDDAGSRNGKPNTDT